MKKIICATVEFLFCLQLIYGQAGKPDSSFGINGIVKADFNGSSVGNKIAVQSDGKIIFAGLADSMITLMRYNLDGSPDKTFDGDGKLVTGFSGDVALLSLVINDGKIVVIVLNSAVVFESTAFTVVRYNSDGSLYNTFTQKNEIYIKAAAVQSDGKIVVAGSEFVLARYNTDGTLDNSFSAEYANFGDDEHAPGTASQIAIMADGKIVAAGTTASSFAVARYNPDGSLDKSFDYDGKQITDFFSYSDYGFVKATSIDVYDGNIVLAGYYGNSRYEDYSNIGLANYDTDGSYVSVVSGFGSYSFASSVAFQDDGKIVLAGGNTPDTFSTLVRFKKDFSADSTFSGDAIQITPIINKIAVAKKKLYAVENNTLVRYLLEEQNSVSPTVNLNLPADNATYLAPAAHIKLSALASDSDGTITKVEFYKDTTLLHTETVVPYGYVWRNVPLGNYTITAKAYDNSGNVTASAPVHISVVPNKPPVVSIISPANKQTFADTATIRLIAAAADTDGKVTNVKFYNRTTLLNIQYQLPYTYNWTNVPAGTYTITAVATDNFGAKTTSKEINIRVTSSTAIVSNRPSSENEKTTRNDALTLRLSPNPANNILNIYTTALQPNKPATLSIISVSGNVLKNIQISKPATQLDVSSLTSGVYTLKMISEDKVLCRQFVKL